jgi:general secretion pathway protein N
MKRVWPLAALGVGAYLLFAVVTLPASLLSSRLGAVGVSAAGLEGTVWKGRAQVVQIANTNLGSVAWDLHVLPLFAARLQADLQLNRSDGFARSAVTVWRSGRVRFSNLNASLPLSALPTRSLPGGWNGALTLKLAELVSEKGWPLAAEGTVEVVDLTGPARRPANIGSYRLIFPKQAAAKSQDALTGALADMGGPLQISGTLQLKPNRSYQVDGFVTTRPDTPRNVADALQMLGEPDAQGRRPFSIAGTM